MARLGLEEKGLLRILERIENREEGPLSPVMRFGLAKRGLIEGSGPPTLTRQGRHMLCDLRARVLRVAAELPAIGLLDAIAQEDAN